MFQDPMFLFFLFLSGLFAGFVNVYAGGGTILTVAIMVFHGVPISTANGTNRIGVLAAASASTYTFFKDGIISVKKALKIGFWAIPGAIAGALFSVNLNNEVFAKIFGFIVIFIAASLFIPNKTDKNTKELNPLVLAISMFLVGIYGGFVQTGVGLIQMAVFKHIAKMDLLKTNAYKMANTLVFTIPAVAVFAFTNSILLDCAVVLAVSSAIGAKIGSVLAIKKGEKFIKIVMFFVLTIIAFMFLTDVK
ncbi:MAG: sulfite exporter TauE/SafE family protein [Chitinispirillales bacterium]|jgi:uncharacterized membrane protein YfcA|nr:sulfite exporter TauE/SafE family protein [Chitinispirillales bacterium]